MGGFFAVASKTDCAVDLFYGTDYHSHLGTMRGGMAMVGENGFVRVIHDISNSQFRSKFEDDLPKMRGTLGIGVISDYEDQPLIIGSHLGTYAIVTVGRILNLDKLAAEAFRGRTTHFSEMGGAGINPTELVATLINRENSFAEGIRCAQELIEGSCSLLLLTEDAIYAARDRLGRTPVAIGCKFLNFSRSKSALDLAARKAIKELEGEDDAHLDDYADPASRRHADMVERIGQQLGLTSLKYQKLGDLVTAIGLPKSRLCTYCWDGAESCCEQLWLLPPSAEAPADTISPPAS